MSHSESAREAAAQCTRARAVMHWQAVTPGMSESDRQRRQASQFGGWAATLSRTPEALAGFFHTGRTAGHHDELVVIQMLRKLDDDHSIARCTSRTTACSLFRQRGQQHSQQFEVPWSARGPAPRGNPVHEAARKGITIADSVHGSRTPVPPQSRQSPASHDLPSTAHASVC